MAAQPEAAPPLSELRAAVADESAPIAKRIRSVFYLRALGTDEAIDAMAQALESPSVLLSHEGAAPPRRVTRSRAAPRPDPLRPCVPGPRRAQWRSRWAR